MLASAHIDFIAVDWSNNICCSAQNDWHGRADLKAIEKNTLTLIEEFAKVKNAPKIAILVGSPDQPDVYHSWDLMRLKLDSIVGMILHDEKLKHGYYHYKGKPFVLNYVGTPSPWQTSLPPWKDDRFTVRHVTGFVSDSPSLMDGHISKYGYWSWEDRTRQS